MDKLAILGGEKTLDHASMPDELFHWPIFTEEDEAAVLDVFIGNEFDRLSHTVGNKMYRYRRARLITHGPYVTDYVTAAKLLRANNTADGKRAEKA